MKGKLNALCKEHIFNFIIRPLLSILIGYLSNVLLTENLSVSFAFYTLFMINCHVSFNGFFNLILSMSKLVINICISYVSYLYTLESQNKRFTHSAKNMETLFKATKFERIVQNVRNGYGILNNQTIHFCNEQFCQALGTKTKAQAMHNLKSILRKPRPHH